MKTNRKLMRALSLLLVLMMVMSTAAFAEGVVNKDETVFVNLDPEGAPVEKISSIWLHSDSALGKIEDKTSLKDIKNVKGDEVPEINGDKIIWNTDKKDIFYQGTTDKELPVELRIQYYLDGKRMNPKDMLGKSGKVKINVSVVNKDSHVIKLDSGKEKDVYTPFVGIVVMNLPIDTFSNVKINSGKLVSDGNNQVITYVTLPGLKQSLDLDTNIIDIPETLVVTADVEGFEMGSVVLTVTSELPEVKDFENAGDFDELIDGIEKIKDASEKLSEATGKLYEGQTTLNDGISEFVNGVDKVNVGANALKDGSAKLKDGVNASYEGSKEIKNGVKALNDGANKLGQGFIGLGQGSIEFSSKAQEFSKGAEQVANGVSQIPEKTQMMSSGINELVQGTEKIQNGQEQLTEGLKNSLDAIEQIKKGKEKELEVVNILLKGVEGLEAAANGLSKVPGADGIAAKMLDGFGKQKMALEGLKQSSNQLISGLNQVEEGIKQAQMASSQLSENIGKVNEGQKKVAYGLDELAKGTSGLGDASKQLVVGSQGLMAGANQLNESAKQANEGVKGFNEGANKLVQGTEKLTNGLGQLNVGANDLNKGANELAKGTSQLSSAGGALKEGSKKLTDGSKELDEGMKKFYQEGILEMSNRVQDSDFNIADIMNTKDKILNLSNDYKSFTGIADEMDGSVKFVMKTEELKMEKEKVEIDTNNNQRDKGGFFNWLKNLFKKAN